jgi:hypothetical protein
MNKFGLRLYAQRSKSSFTCFGHANPAVDDGQSVGGLVGNDVDEELGLGVELALVCEAFKTNLVESLRTEIEV